MVSQTIRVLGKEGQTEKYVEVDQDKGGLIQVEAPISEIHLNCEDTEQPHLADDCDSDVEMPSPKESESLGNNLKGKVSEEEKLKAHLNVM